MFTYIIPIKDKCTVSQVLSEDEGFVHVSHSAFVSNRGGGIHLNSTMSMNITMDSCVVQDQPYGIAFFHPLVNTTDLVVVRNTDFSDISIYGLYLTSSTIHLDVQDCQFERNRHGVVWSPSADPGFEQSTVTIKGTNYTETPMGIFIAPGHKSMIHIANCIFRYGTFTAIHISDVVSGLIYVGENQFSGHEKALFLQTIIGGNVTVIDNTFTQTDEPISTLSLSVSSFVISSNTITGSISQYGPVHLIYYHTGASYSVTVQQNTITQCGGQSAIIFSGYNISATVNNNILDNPRCVYELHVGIPIDKEGK